MGVPIPLGADGMYHYCYVNPDNNHVMHTFGPNLGDVMVGGPTAATEDQAGWATSVENVRWGGLPADKFFMYIFVFGKEGVLFLKTYDMTKHIWSAWGPSTIKALQVSSSSTVVTSNPDVEVLKRRMAAIGSATAVQ